MRPQVKKERVETWQVRCSLSISLLFSCFIKNHCIVMQIDRQWQTKSLHIRRTQLLFATGIEGGIHDRQILKYQSSVTSRVIFHDCIPLVIIKYWIISLDVTDGWYFRAWRLWMPPSMPEAKSNWVCLLRGYWKYTVGTLIPVACLPACISYSNFMPILNMSIGTTFTFIMSHFLL